ncbi:MAG TPA: ATP-binding protein [Thermoanaerobaculia bacterium]|nr:ATP-binding protein [Thermoanaerobaculia bacterium]
MKNKLLGWKLVDVLWTLASVLVLIPCLYYPYLATYRSIDFVMTPSTGKVITSSPCAPNEKDCTRLGDRILTFGGVEWQTFNRNRLLPLDSVADADGYVTIRVERQGQIREFRQLAFKHRADWRQLTPLAVLPLVLWLMGTIAVFLLRPRDERWLLLVLFSYITAIWFAAGQASNVKAGGTAVVFHFFVWFFLPLAIHLHLILPSWLLSPRQRARILVPLYLLALTLSLLDSFYLLGNYDALYVLTSLAGVAGALSLFLIRLFLPLPVAVKIANRIMLYGLVLGLGPFILFFGAISQFYPIFNAVLGDVRVLFPWFITVSSVSLLILPMSYIYAIYKHHLGALEFRANRLIGVYSYMVLATTPYIVALFAIASRWPPINQELLTSLLFTSLLFVTTTPFLLNRFQALVDRHVFGIRHSAEEVIELVSERIPTAFDRTVLAHVIGNEILPALLIRQSALYLFEGDRVEALHHLALPEGEPGPDLWELRELLTQSGRYRPPGPADVRFGWVRLALPLTVQGRTVGGWLIGRRDPDDFFPVSDIHLLSTVANQVAPMLENIRLFERAQQEIAQRKAAEEEIRSSEERFRTLFEATLEGIAIVRNGVILEVNNALLGILGTAPEEVIGRRLSEVVEESGAELDHMPRESVALRSDGTQVDIEIAGKKYVFQGEDVTVVAIRDIAERKRNEAENKMLQRQLLHSQKMEAIGRLSAGVAHDFNNCLLAIFGYSDLVLDRHREDPFLTRNLTGIKEAGQKAASLTKQLLAFARRQPMEARVMGLNPIITGLEKMLHRLLGEDVTLISDLQADMAKVRIDPGQMEQVIMNLVVNARQAMPTGGRLTIRTAQINIASESAAPHANVPVGSYVLLSVTDTGSGMDAETQARAFEPFFSTKGEGTGLGLSTVYGVVQQSGGFIFVDSAPGQGACFSIYLPVTSEQESSEVLVVPVTEGTGSETVLLVEDEDEVRKVLHQILIGKGYRVFQAGSGEEALAISRLHRGAVHLLLTDVTMPRMKGTELASRLLSERPQTRVIFMSGYNEERLSGGESTWTCLQKPFSQQTLTQTVRAILDATGEAGRREAAIA